MQGQIRATRVQSLDGLRGLMAFVVFVSHLFQAFGSCLLMAPAKLCVCGFFALSGYVLTRAWDGDFGVFLARRFTRLWPVYAFCLGCGYLLAGASPVWSEFFWYPILTANSQPQIDPPIWSLGIEAWAMLFMPLIVQARGSLILAVAMIVVCSAAAKFVTPVGFGVFFIAGAYLSRFDLRSRVLESAVPQWLGRVSYSLYLSHWLVIEVGSRLFGDAGRIAAAPIALLVGWLVWRGLELPSINWSRAVGVWLKQNAKAPDALGEARAPI